MSMWQGRLARRRRCRGQEGQSLVETAIAMPLLLGLSFNIINWSYLWFMVLALSAAPRMGAQYATQGGAAGTATAPGTTVVSNLVYDNLTSAISGATTSNAAVQVCTSAKGIDSSTGIAQCDQFGAAFSISAADADSDA